MKQRQFEQHYRPEWRQLEKQLARLEQRTGKADMKKEELADLPQRHRRLCHQLALARDRGYSLSLLQELDGLMLRAHRQLYRRQPPVWAPLRRLVVHDFPARVREQRYWHLASAVVFLGSLALVFSLVHWQPDMVHAVMDAKAVENMEKLYDPSSDARKNDRGSGQDMVMFGYYIMNNIGIAFRTFAGGIFLGIGALFVMLFNGSYFGAVAAHLNNIGAGEPFFTFVIAHGAPELTAIVLAGGAGLRLGWSLVAPGPWPRLEALRRAARECLPVIHGVFLLLVLAAAVEAFWSPRPFPSPVKYGVGATLWLLVLTYLWRGGRHGS